MKVVIDIPEDRYADIQRIASVQLDRRYPTPEQIIAKGVIINEPRKGKWIKISPANIYECSECGKNVMTDDISAYDFCHGCGTDMRGEHDESIITT